jgi:ABC-type Fe3+ transport system substrate-binding protein
MRMKLLVLIIVSILIVASVVSYVIYVSRFKEVVKLVIASRLSAEEAEVIRSAFLGSDIAKKYNIVDVEIKKLDFSLWRDLGLRGEVDLFLVGEAAIFNSLCEEGVFRAMDLKELLDVVKEVPQNFVGYSKDGSVCWVGIGLGVYGFIVNKEFLQRYGLDIPKSWLDIVNASYTKVLAEGRYLISFPLPSKSGTARTTVIGILQRYGWEDGWRILTAIGSLSSFVTSSEKARDDAAMGVVGVAPAYIGYGLQAEKVSSGKAVFITPRGETIPYVSPVAIAKGSKHPVEAQAFILWLLGSEGQRIVVEKFGYLPVRNVPGLEAMAARTREALENSMNYNTGFEIEVREAVVTYFEASIADPDVNKLLVEVMKKIAVVKPEEFSKWVRELGSPLTIRDPLTGSNTVFTYEYAKQISVAIREGRVSRDDLYQRVKEAAISRLTSILAELSR